MHYKKSCVLYKRAQNSLFMENHLVFLTSTSDSIPSGRNARVAARASLVRNSARPTAARGTFDTFSVRLVKEGEESHHGSTSSDSSLERSFRTRSDRRTATRRWKGSVPLLPGPQSVAIEGLLASATERIKSDLASILEREPSRVRDVLRCRYWAEATFALGNLRFTPEVHSAVQYLEHKISTLDQSDQSSYVGMQKYGIALAELQQSLRDPKRRMQPSVLSASHILAICEMLGDRTGRNYFQFAKGIISISSLQARKGDHSARLHVRSNAGTIFVEALLAKRYDAIVDQPWPQLIISAADEGRLSQSDAVLIADSADLIFSKSRFVNSEAPGMLKRDKDEMIARAYQLQFALKQCIHNNLVSTDAGMYGCPVAVTISEQVAAMLGLDDFVSQLSGGHGSSTEQVSDDNTSFYAEVISSL